MVRALSVPRGPVAGRASSGSLRLPSMSRRLEGLAQSDIRAMTRARGRRGRDQPGPGHLRPAHAAAGGRGRHRGDRGPEEHVHLRGGRRGASGADRGQARAGESDHGGPRDGDRRDRRVRRRVHLRASRPDGSRRRAPDPEPYYGYHVGAARVAGVVPRFVQLEGEGLRLTEEGLRARITERTRALVLCTPSNPSGRMLDREEIEVAARVAVEHDLLVITDEIYESITYDGRKHVSPASVGGDGPRDGHDSRPLEDLQHHRLAPRLRGRTGSARGEAEARPRPLLHLRADPAPARRRGRVRPARQLLRGDAGGLRSQAGPRHGDPSGGRVDAPRAGGRLLRPQRRLLHGRGERARAPRCA